MKSFPSPTATMSSHCFAILILLHLIFVTSATSISNPASLVTYSRNHQKQPYHHHYHYILHICGSLSHESSRTLCSDLQRIHRYRPLTPLLQPPPTLPSSPDHDIDPRYGVEKRLVPSGPNPLHN
ncbi:hypothetical protein CFOL_v3_35182 [Cephalotus follicularis]|uniref:Uncharacterized protein n=1 Tax=Cephalotus follicularis TaxID=3775 RepID=A0A1Q3DGZ0_CEPFO|nr:hypothetical protein CFOL_v3_35182 [Cephalotus follicularis]